jgi:hypothetical protein
MIPLIPDPDDMPRHMPPEHCCFCGSATRMWYAPRDVAVCTSCAQMRDESEVPTKDEWCESPQAFGIRPAPGTVVLDRLRGGRRMTLRLNEDGSYLLYVNDVAEPTTMDAHAAIDWLAVFAAELAPPPPSAREMYGSDRGLHGLCAQKG